MDEGRKQTDKLLSEMEKKIAKEYKQAEKEIEEKLNDYLERFAAKDKIKRQAVKSGEITQKEYNDWRKGQIMIGQRWTEMKNTLAEDYHNANLIARSTIYGYMPEVYALNHNYGTFEVESQSQIDTSYTLYDRQTVERLMRDNPDLLPPVGKKLAQRIAAGQDVLWNKQLIQSAMIQSILQGESIDKIAKRLSKQVGDTNKAASIRNARTMTTSAENAGRVNSYKRAQDMGINLTQQWIATLDGRTRDSHRYMDGETVKVGGVFSNGLRYPADPEGRPSEVWNCRCTLICQLKGFQIDASDLNLRRSEKLNGMSYEEWKYEHTYTEARKYRQNGKSVEYDAFLNKTEVEESLAYKNTITSKESEIKALGYETAILLDGKGKEIFRESQKNRGSVFFTAEQSKAMKGCTLLHNHPSGSTFSVEDINTFMVTDMYCIRATSENITYQLKHKGKRSNKQDFVVAYKDAQQDNKIKTDKKYDKIKHLEQTDRRKFEEECNKLNKELGNLNRRWLKENAKNYGLRYSEITKR